MKKDCIVFGRLVNIYLLCDFINYDNKNFENNT